MSTPQDPFAVAKIVLTGPDTMDPAIDTSAPGAAEALERYRETLDVAVLPKRPGTEFTFVELHPVKATACAELIESGKTPTQTWNAAFLATCRAIHVPGRAHPMTPNDKEMIPVAGLARVAPASWADEVGTEIHTNAIYEIGRIALRLSKLGNRGKALARCWVGGAATT